MPVPRPAASEDRQQTTHCRIAPDLEAPLPILSQRALVYRLCGDRKPPHSDPESAAAVGFSQPILHGLCTYVSCKALDTHFWTVP
jgi:hypothetical protein